MLSLWRPDAGTMSSKRPLDKTRCHTQVDRDPGGRMSSFAQCSRKIKPGATALFNDGENHPVCGLHAANVAAEVKKATAREARRAAEDAFDKRVRELKIKGAQAAWNPFGRGMVIGSVTLPFDELEKLIAAAKAAEPKE